MPEDALSKEPTQHDYTDTMRLEAPHEVVTNPDYKPGRPDTPRGLVEDQKARLDVTEGEPVIDGVSGLEPGTGEPVAAATGDVTAPAGNASTDEWRTWAKEHRGATDADLDGLSRAEIREKYSPAA